MLTWQYKSILERSLPEKLKLTIAKRIESNLFAKVTWFFSLKLLFVQQSEL